MTEFLVDPEYTRSLATDLHRAAQPTYTPPLSLPSFPSLAAFTTAMQQAANSVQARAAALRDDLGHLSRAGAALADATVATDTAAARALSALSLPTVPTTPAAPAVSLGV